MSEGGNLMSEFRSFIREEYLSLLVMVLFSSLSFLLFLVPIWGIFSFVLSITLSTFFLFQYHKEKNKRQKELSCLCFFSSFIHQISNQKGSKESYDNSCKYLLGYQEVIPYETLLENPSCPYSLHGFSSGFVYCLTKDKENEAHLLNYHFLMKKADAAIETDDSFLKGNQKELIITQSSFLFFMIIVAFCFAYFPNIRQFLNTYYYLIAQCLTIGLVFPTLYMAFWLSLRGRKHV
jgi:hypothetical protein